MNQFKLHAVITFLFNLAFLIGQKGFVSNLENRDPASTNHRGIPCATPDPTVEQIIQSKAEVDEWLMQNENRNRNQVVVYVIWHVIYASDGTGNISDNRIIAQIEAMNQEFQMNNSNIFFSLDSINRVENTEWFTGWAYFGDALDDVGMQELHYDPAHYLNIYSAQLYDSGAGSLVTLGYTAFPTNLSETSYMQGFTLDHRAVSGGLYGSQSAVHEAGHYFGLYHTFQTNCLAPDDAVDD